MLTFPLQKEDAGNSAWKLAHHKASLYSDSPTDKEKERMKIFLYETFRSVSELCDNCKKHIHDYLKSHPIQTALTNKKSLSKYLCEFHNSVNERNGKDIVNCHTILGEKNTCSNCNVVKKDSVHDLKNAFERFKDASKNVFFKLCDRWNVPHPEIKFHECPSNPETSCTAMWVDPKTQDIIERPIVYLHPNVMGLRTIPHEFVHYMKQLKKDLVGGIDEKQVEAEAQEILNRDFPFDTVDKSELTKGPIQQVAPIIRNDMIPVNTRISRLRNFPNAARIYDKHLAYRVNRKDSGFQPDEQGDWIFDMMKGVKENKDEGVETEVVEAFGVRREDNRNALSFLDGLYAPFASLFGMKQADMNRTNTPVLLSNAALTIMKTHLSPIGALLASTLTSLGIYGALALSRNGLSMGDKMLMNSFGTQFFWSALDYTRPGMKEDVIEGAMDLGNVVSQQEWSVLPNILLGETLQSMVFGGVGETVQAASPLSATRNAQRSSLGGGSASIGSTSSNSRRSQRASGVVPIGQQVAENARNISTGAATGGNPALRKRLGGSGTNAVPMFDEATIIPSDDDGVYESAFGMHVSDGRGRYAEEVYSTYEDTDPAGIRRNSIRDIFETDTNYDNFNDVYYEEEEAYG